jgi:hypothetical protein
MLQGEVYSADVGCRWKKDGKETGGRDEIYF